MIFILLNGEKSEAENIDKLISDLESHKWASRLVAVEQLGKISDQRSTDILMDISSASKENWKVRIKAIRLLGESRDRRAIDVLTEIFNNPFLNSDCPAIKWNIAIALGNFKKNSKVTDALISGIEDKDLMIREASIQSLGKTGDPKAVPFLIPLLNDEHFAIKFSTIKSLGEIREPQAISFLRKVADNDADPYIRNEALTALSNFPSHKD